MSLKRCLNPILAFMKFNPRTGKNELSDFQSVRSDYFESSYLFDCTNDSFSYDAFKKYVKTRAIKYGENAILLPCRKCVNCQLNRSQEWAIRNSLEAREYDESQCLFITLTYDNDNANQNLKKVFSNYHGIDLFSLKKTDLQLFMKSLRKRFSNFKLRFFAVGEYGGITFRPHFHILIYGLSIDDIKSYKDKKGNMFALDYKYETKDGKYYYSELIEKHIWKKGFVDITNFSIFTAMYTSRYCTKKQTRLSGEKGVIYYNDLQPVFNTMSLRPPIANDYVIKNLDKIYKNDEFLYHFDGKTMSLKPLAFFDRKYDVERPDEFKFVKENRKSFSNLFKYFDEIDTNLTISEYLRNEEAEVYKKLKVRRNV